MKSLKNFKGAALLCTAVFTLFLLIMACSSDEKSESTKNVKTEVKVSAAKLLRDYKKNEVAADEKYKSKIAEISGRVNNIKKDITDTLYVTFRSGKWSITSVQCYFADDQKSELAKLKKGQKIVIKGKIDGLFGNVLVKNCIVVK